MRQHWRTGTDVLIWPRQTETGELGGSAEGFSSEGIAARASVSYVTNSLNGNLNALTAAPYGVRAAQAIRLRFIGAAALAAGDGVSLPGEDGPAWRCLEVDRYPLVTVARLERIAQ